MEQNTISSKMIGLILLIFIFLISGYVIRQNTDTTAFYAAEDTARADTELALLSKKETDFTVGAENPEIRMVIYGDTDCPFCARFETVIDELLQKHSNVSITYRHYKLPIYPASRAEHIALECVGMIAGADSYREFQNDYLYQNKYISIEESRAGAEELGKDFLPRDTHKPFDVCMDDPDTRNRIENKVHVGNTLGVRQTPTWFVIKRDEYKMYVGQVDFPTLQSILFQE